MEITMTDDRIARFEERRAALAKLSDDELRERFWKLTNEVVAPILDLAKGHTSPSIERAVLLRMGIDSVTTQGVVQRISDAGLLGKGAGHVVLKLSQRTGKDLRAAAQSILDDASVLQGLFGAA
ncbi:MAG: D-ornithine 4,5-aminomutase subunit OraS [Thermoanaerobaculia bacterium]